MIRRANVLDISAIIFMLNEMHKETKVEVPKINTHKLINKINELLHKGLVLVAIEDNRIVGSIAGTTVNDWWSDEMYISDAWFYVFPKHRKSSYAKNLCIDFIKIAKEAKLKVRLGHVFSGDLERKDKFYERLGLVKVGSTYMEI
jgi:GNAT superfamily N-acetyltransferase|tara:strand:- start:42 stop:476 length:435 start_codon:yes stop_codon:yes gene_type:complete